MFHFTADSAVSAAVAELCRLQERHASEALPLLDPQKDLHINEVRVAAAACRRPCLRQRACCCAAW